ncbi:RNHCP domain-containing protein [Candidatus Peregrinibacteria bacterium]|nr:RNHCP domain-containing protein [Candidatus Peregrinibacteria bacterium]
MSINEGFICQNCKHKVPSAEKTCRNHCTECLYSLHVDKEIPGDRLATCEGLMQPISLEITRNKGYVITHECLSCKKIQKNKTAKDDNFDSITELLKKTNERNLK